MSSAAAAQAARGGTVVVVIGPGMMGRGIAACAAAGGPHEVRLVGRRQEAAEEGAAKAEALVSFLAENEVAAPVRGRIIPMTSLEEALVGAEFVFESIVEDLEAKQALFRELARLAEPSAILCTNTSSLPVSGVAAACAEGDPAAERIMAAHFVGPAHLVPLVELCPAQRTAPADAEGPVARVYRFLESIGKKPIVMKKEIDGFIAARLQAALYRECLHIVQSGAADCEAVDCAVFNGFGRRLNQIGPFIQADFAGVDLVQRTHATFFPQLGNYQRDLRADVLVEEGRKGIKTLAGHYDWTEETAVEVARRRDAELLRRLKVDMEAKSRL